MNDNQSFPLTVSTILNHSSSNNNNNNNNNDNSIKITTNVICKRFDDKILILISQDGVMGTLVKLYFMIIFLFFF